MSHFHNTDWADFVRGQFTDLDHQAMQAHLDAGCSACGNTVAALEQVMAVAQTDRQTAPPEWAVRSVKTFFALDQPERVPKLKSLALQLAFDSFLEPAPAGIRSLETSSRHLVYYAQNYALDLRLDYEPNSHNVLLGGEILDRKFGPVANIPAFLIADEKVVSRSTSSDLGEFNLAGERAESLRLCLVMSDDERIDVSLDSRRPSRSGDGTGTRTAH